MKKQRKKEFRDLAERIRTLRTDSDMTQIDLAAKMNIDVRTVKYLESGDANPTYATMLLLADALDVDIKALF